MSKISLQGKTAPILSLSDLNFIRRIIVKNWWILILLPLIAYVLGYLYTYRLTIVHKASTEFLIQSDDMYYKNNLVTDANFVNYSTYIDNSNEQRIIQSYDLISEVVTQLKAKLEVSYFIVGKVKTIEQFNGMPFLVEVSSMGPNFYELPFFLKIINSDKYELSYIVNNETKKIIGFFNKTLVTTDFIFNIHASDYNKQFQKFYRLINHNRDVMFEVKLNL